MSDRPPDWVLEEAAKRSDWDDAGPENRRIEYRNYPMFRALCDMIAKYEQPPVDRKLLCAEEALKQWREGGGAPTTWISVRAIELFEEGFGK